MANETEAPKCDSRPVKVEGSSLSPLVAPNSTVEVVPTSCIDEIERDALVLFRSGAMKKPIIKQVRALGGDRFELKNGRILVEEKILDTATGKPFSLSEERQAVLRMYVRDYNGIIPENTFLLLGTNPAGALDSTRLGLIHRNDIIGVVKP